MNATAWRPPPRPGGLAAISTIAERLPPSLRPLEPPSRGAIWADLVFSGLFTLFLLGLGLIAGQPAFFFMALGTLVLAVRRTSPQLLFLSSVVVLLLQVPAYDFPLITTLTVPLVVYNTARWTPRPWSRAALIAGLAGSIIGPVRWSWRSYGEPSAPLSTVAMTLVCVAMVLTPYLIGRRRLETTVAAQLRQEAESRALRMQLAESEQRARVAEIRERQRIARELHDIVAHSLSVIIVQAEGGRALAAKRPEATAEALSTISETGREALDEMRRIMGVLRNDAGPTEYAPAAGLADIQSLVAKTTDRATYVQRGELPTVNATLGLTAYRVVQEALTNMLKHAGPAARAEVLLDCSHPQQLRVQVSDDGRGAAAGSDGLGNGLRGMNERVQLLGGTLISQPKPGGGFLVRAVLPLADPRAASRGNDSAATVPLPSPRPRQSFVEPRPEPTRPLPMPPDDAEQPTHIIRLEERR